MTWLSDTLTATTGTLLTAHTADIAGGTWVSVMGATSPQMFSTLGGVVGGPAGITLYRNTTISPSADVVLSATTYYDSVDFNNVGIAGRLNAAGTAGYLAIYSASTHQWGIFRLGPGQSTTLIGTSATITYAQGDTPAISAFTISGTGATVSITLAVGGAVVIATISDTHADRATGAGYAGVWANHTTADSGMFVSSIIGDDAAATTTITYTTPKSGGHIYPLSNGTTGTATFSATGTYTGIAPDQWRLVPDGSSTSVSGFDWQSFTTTPSAGTFSQSIAGVPKLAGWYNIQLRVLATPGTFYTTGKVGAGAMVAVDGQSQVWLWFSATAFAGDGTLTPDAMLRYTGVQASDTWLVPNTSTMNAAISCGNALVSALGCPVGLIDGSWDGSGLTVTANGGQWVPTAGTTYQRSLSAVNTAGGKVIANVWGQGEADAGSGVTQSNYYSGLGTMIAQRRTDVSAASLPYVIATLARNNAGASDSSREAIKLAQVQMCADSNIYRVDRMDLPLHTDGVHHTATGFTALGARVAQAILASVGIVSQYRGPSIASVVQVSAGVFDVNLTHHSGSDFTPTSAITGLRFTDPGASNAVISVSTAVRQSASVIRVTLSTTPVSLPNVDNLYGAMPTVTSVVKDNSALTLPLEYTRNIAATNSLRAIFQKSLLSGIGSGGSFFQNPIG